MRDNNFWPVTLITVVLAVLIVFISRWLDWSFGITLAVLLAVSMLLWLALTAYTMQRLGWLRRFQKVGQRLQRGEGDAVLAEFTARRTAGDPSPEVTLALAAAYNWLGRGQEAESLARELLTFLEQRGDFQKKDMSSKAWSELALIALYDAWVLQGRFAEAANSLRPHVPQAIQPNFMTAIIAWGFFLAGDDDNTRTVLAQLQPMTRRGNNKRNVSIKFQFMVAHMRHKLMGEDRRADMLRLRAQLAEWEKEAARGVATPYGVRLRAILDDVQMVLGS